MTDRSTTLINRLKKHIEHNREHRDPAKRRDAFLAQDALAEIERLKDILATIEMLTAVAEGLEPDHCISVHMIAAEGRSDDPAAWRADPAAIEKLLAAFRGEGQEALKAIAEDPTNDQ